MFLVLFDMQFDFNISTSKPLYTTAFQRFFNLHKQKWIDNNKNKIVNSNDDNKSSNNNMLQTISNFYHVIGKVFLISVRSDDLGSRENDAEYN
jgi:hypothetical protein